MVLATASVAQRRRQRLISVGGTGAAPPPIPNVKPNSNFSFGVDGLDATFESLATDSDGTIVAHAWDFGDGSNSSDVDPSHTYANGGNYTVELTVTDNDGATSTATKPVVIEDPNVDPVADFSFVADGLEVAFTSLATDSDGTIVAHAWDFGDNQSSTSVNRTITYSAAGTYDVELTVIDDDGATHSVTKSVSVSAAGPITRQARIVDSVSRLPLSCPPPAVTTDWLQPILVSDAERLAYVQTQTDPAATYDDQSCEYTFDGSGVILDVPLVTAATRGIEADDPENNPTVIRVTDGGDYNSDGTVKAGTLRQAIADAEMTAGYWRIECEVPHIELMRKLVCGADHGRIISTHPDATTATGAEFALENAAHLAVSNMRFYNAIQQFSSAGGTARDCMAIRNSSRILVERCAFSFGHDGNCDVLNSTVLFRNNIVSYGLHEAKAMVLVGDAGEGSCVVMLENNAFAHHWSRPTHQGVYSVCGGNVIYNYGAIGMSIESNPTSSQSTQVDFFDNLWIDGPQSSASQESVRCLSKTLDRDDNLACYDGGGNIHRNTSGTDKGWEFEPVVSPTSKFGCDPYESLTQLNDWLPGWVAGTALDLSNDVGTFNHDGVESQVIDDIQNGTGLSDPDNIDEGEVFVASQVGYNAKTNTFSTCGMDVVIFGVWSSDGITAQMDIADVRDAAGVDLPGTTPARLTIRDRNGSIVYRVSGNVGQDFSTLAAESGSTSGLLKTGSVIGSAGQVNIDLTKLASHANIRVEVETEVGNPCESYSAADINP